MNDRSTVSMVIAPSAEIRHDLWANKRAIFTALIIIIIYVFASSFLMLQFDPAAVESSEGASLYFTITNVTTVGFGDLHPSNSCGRVIASINSVAGVILFGIVVSIITLAFQPRSSTFIPNPIPRADAGNFESNPQLVLPRRIGFLLDELQRAVLEVATSKDKGTEESAAKHIHLHAESADGRLIHINIELH